MTVSERKLLKVLRTHVSMLDESNRVPGYRDDVLETLAQIVILEKENLEARTQIQKKITDQANALGRVLIDGDWEQSP